MLEALFLIVGLLVGVAIGYFVCKNAGAEEKTALVSSRDVLQNKVNLLEEQLNKTELQSKQQLEKAESQAKEQLEQLRQHTKEQVEQQMNLIREQMTTTSEKVLKERSEQLSADNKDQLSSILTPLQEHLKQMREAVEKSDRDRNDTMARLDETIKSSIAQSKMVGERADKLAQALTGENKTQGNFGELRLRQLLEGMGLEEGSQFEEQFAMRDSNNKVIYDEEGHKLIPDVILHFPDKRDVIIDSKISFTAFEDYCNAETDEAKQDALKRHLASVRSHVLELSKKNYSKHIREGHNKLDFVIMYMFSESALQLAIANDVNLFKEAFEKGVIISGSQNLYALLRVLEMSWKQVQQVENQENIMKCADTIIERVQMFAERFAKVDEMLEKTRRSFDDIKGITGSSGRSIETAARNLLKYGANESPKHKKLQDGVADTMTLKSPDLSD